MYRYTHRRADRQGRTKDTIAIPLVAWDESEDTPDIPGAYLDEDEYRYYVDLPMAWRICETCRGNGTHVNRAIDGNGLSSTDFDEWDEDEVEMYFSGGYDVRCEARCQDGKLRDVCLDALEPWQQRVYDEWLRWEEEVAREGAYDARTRWYEDGCPMG